MFLRQLGVLGSGTGQVWARGVAAARGAIPWGQCVFTGTRSRDLLFSYLTARTMAHPPPDRERLSAALWDKPPNLRGRNPATSPALPPAKPDPPMPLNADALHLPCGVPAALEDSETPTDVGSCTQESAQLLGDSRVRDRTGIGIDECRLPNPDPAVVAVQGALHGVLLPSTTDACSMAALLVRAIIMFTGGVGGPWSSGLGVATPKVTKGLLLAAAEAIAVGLGWKPGARPAAVEVACGVLDRREALAYLIGDAVLGVGLLKMEDARSVGQAAGKQVWVAKGTAPLRKEVADAKLAVQRSAGKRSLDGERLTSEKANAEAAVLREQCAPALPLPLMAHCRAIVIKPVPRPPSDVTPTISPSTALATSAADASEPPPLPPRLPPPTLSPPMPSPPSPSHPLTPPPPPLTEQPAAAFTAAVPPALPIPSSQDIAAFTCLGEERAHRLSGERTRQAAAEVGVIFYWGDILRVHDEFPDVVLPGTCVSPHPPPPPSDSVVHIHVACTLGEVIWMVEAGFGQF